jgi:hypothetical protein
VLLFAHTGPCRASEAATTVGLASVIGVLLFRPWRRPSRRSRLFALGVPIVLAAVVTTGACSPKTGSSSNRPTTAARLVIESPQPNQVMPPDFALQLRLIGGQVVKRTTGKLSGTEGHIHVSIDNKLVSMAYGTSQDLHGLQPGNHVLLAEFVATDHRSFKNPQKATVLFSVKQP